MAKFKVGDKVRVVRDWKLTNGSTFIDKIATITMDDGTGCYPYRIDIDGGNNPWEDGELELIKQPVREFIVLRRDGAKTIAELRHDREVIKSAVATCYEKDTFNFETGAKLAFDRLMNRQNIEEAVKAWNEHAPQPAHRFKVGDRVVVNGKHAGEISAISIIPWDREPYLIYCPEIGTHSGGGMQYGARCKPEHDGKCFWSSENRLSPAPAPEPPKFYTGKVFAERSTDKFFSQRDGHVFEFVDGVCINATADQQMDGVFTSFNDLVVCAGCTKWHEVKSDV